jgi:hypothetical protein
MQTKPNRPNMNGSVIDGYRVEPDGLPLSTAGSTSRCVATATLMGVDDHFTGVCGCRTPKTPSSDNAGTRRDRAGRLLGAAGQARHRL